MVVIDITIAKTIFVQAIFAEQKKLSLVQMAVHVGLARGFTMDITVVVLTALVGKFATS